MEKKPLRKKKQGAWNKCREETLTARAAALAAESAGESETPPDNSGSTPPDNSGSVVPIVTGGTPNQNQGEQKSQRPMDKDKTFDWAKNWWVLPLGLGVLYLGYTKFIKKK